MVKPWQGIKYFKSINYLQNHGQTWSWFCLANREKYMTISCKSFDKSNRSWLVYCAMDWIGCTCSWVRNSRSFTALLIIMLLSLVIIQDGQKPEHWCKILTNERPSSYFSSFALKRANSQIHERTLTNGCNKFWQVKQFIFALPGRSRVNLTSKFTSIYWVIVTVWQCKAKIGLGSETLD